MKGIQISYDPARVKEDYERRYPDRKVVGLYKDRRQAFRALDQGTGRKVDLSYGFYVVTEEPDLEAANRFWAEARARVLAIAEAADLRITIEEHDDEFLFELFDNGDHVPTDSEIVEALEEYAFE